MSDLIVDYSVIADARDKIVVAHEAVDFKALRGLESSPLPQLTQAFEDASDYASGVLALATLDLMRVAQQLTMIERAFRETDAASQAALSGDGDGGAK